MKRGLSLVIITAIFLLSSQFALAKKNHYGAKLCKQNGFHCYKVKSGDTWHKLFPDEEIRDVVMRINRTNMRLRAGQIIALPNKPNQLDYFTAAPFPLKQDAKPHKTIIVDLNHLAWGAYDQNGHLVNWGPASGGKGWCSDVGRPCLSQTGNYKVIGKKDYNCVSSKFPLPYGGAAMPYCMHYYRAYALHGSFEVPGYNASHGCIRLFINDARWLNYDFADYGTKVVVKPYE